MSFAVNEPGSDRVSRWGSEGSRRILVSRNQKRSQNRHVAGPRKRRKFEGGPDTCPNYRRNKIMELEQRSDTGLNPRNADRDVGTRRDSARASEKGLKRGRNNWKNMHARVAKQMQMRFIRRKNNIVTRRKKENKEASHFTGSSSTTLAILTVVTTWHSLL